MNELAYNPPWPGWGSGMPMNQKAPIKLNTVTSYDVVKEDRLPPGSMKDYFREDEDIVYIKIVDDLGKATIRGFHMTEFDVEKEEALNGTVTEGRLNEAINGLEDRLSQTMANMLGQLKEELSNGKQPVRSGNSGAAKRQEE